MSRLSRKEFLKRSLLVSVAAPFTPILTGCESSPLPVQDEVEGESNEAYWTAVRNQYLIDESIVNLNNGSVGPQSVAVQEAHIEMYKRSNEAPSYYMWREVNKKREPLREALASLMEAATKEVAINRNTTEGLNTVIFGLNLEAGDEVVVSDYDYPFMLNAWHQRQMRDGIVVKKVKLPLPIEDIGQAVDYYRKAITTKTKVVHLTQVINWTGQVMPVKEITKMAQRLGCQVVVDAAHSVGQIPLSFKDIGCDYMATSLHKWLGAPFGTGALLVKENRIASLWPSMSPYEPQSDDIRKFEFLGTRSIPAEMAALKAIEFHLKIGAENVHSRLHFLKCYWAEQVRVHDSVRLHTSLNPEFSAAIATFSIDGMTASQIATNLWESDQLHLGLIQWNELDAIRVSPHIYTSLQELDKLAAAIIKLSSK